MDFHGFSWIFMDFHVFSCIFMDFPMVYEATHRHFTGQHGVTVERPPKRGITSAQLR